MPSRPVGVYPDGKGGWYYKVSAGRDPSTGKRIQITRRAFRTAGEAGRARREELTRLDKGGPRPVPRGLTIGELLDLYLQRIDVDGHLAAKTRFDYRRNVENYVRPYLGSVRVRDLTSLAVSEWQRKLSSGGTVRERTGQDGKPLPARGLSPNTVRLARAPLSGAMRLAVEMGMVSVNPVSQVSQPRLRQKIPPHWSSAQAREFLSLMEGDRTWAIWAFLLSTGLRIGEVVWLRWSNVDLDNRRVRIVEFAATLGHDLVSSEGKSPDALRTIEIDQQLVEVLEGQRTLQQDERQRSSDYDDTDFVFTKPNGGSYHPQYLSRRLGVLSVECGLPRLTAHGLRHTCSTMMLEAGVPGKAAAERLGHSDTALFLNVYSHVTPTMQTEAADRLGQALLGPQE